ncbi:MAG: amino acid dehydrogenase [Sandaracinaceae bacterium]|nr:amino acid dehydrogenase [Sandaracinaceae bacterium]
MQVFRAIESHGFGEAHFACDARLGLRAIIAIHSVARGPALGGCRFVDYESEEAALIDVLRLARGMTYKAALAQLPLGGGKSVVLRPKGEFDREALFVSFGRFVDALGGRYITAEDSGTSVEDMRAIRKATPHVTGLPIEEGGSGDPSPWTALGVRMGIEACVRFALKRESLRGLRIAIQGVGHVGAQLASDLAEGGAELVISDIHPERAKAVAERTGAKILPPESIFDAEVDVFAPCALGAILNDSTISRLRAGIVAGAANNQLAEARHGDLLHERGVLYAPDYAINAGGLINVCEELLARREGRPLNPEKIRAQVVSIFDTIMEILERSKKRGVPTHRIADDLAEERLGQLS